MCVLKHAGGGGYGRWTAGCWTHRRCGQTGPADGLRAGVQRRVFGLVEDGVHTERLLAVHRHHDCRSQRGSLSVFLVRLRFGRFLPRNTSTTGKKQKKKTLKQKPGGRRLESRARDQGWKRRRAGEVAPGLLPAAPLPPAPAPELTSVIETPTRLQILYRTAAAQAPPTRWSPAPST